MQPPRYTRLGYSIVYAGLYLSRKPIQTQIPSTLTHSLIHLHMNWDCEAVRKLRTDKHHQRAYSIVRNGCCVDRKWENQVLDIIGKSFTVHFFALSCSPCLFPVWCVVASECMRVSYIKWCAWEDVEINVCVAEWSGLTGLSEPAYSKCQKNLLFLALIMRHISFSTYENVLKSRFTTETAHTHTNTHPHTLECIETSPQNRIVEREIMVIFLLPFGYIMLLRIESTEKKHQL